MSTEQPIAPASQKIAFSTGLPSKQGAHFFNDDPEERKRIDRKKYENSPLAELEGIIREASGNDQLFNQRPPPVAILHEKPEHRVVCYLKAQGKTNREISDLTGNMYTPEFVSTILRQPWAVAKVLEIIKTNGEDAVSKILESEAVASVQTLIQIRDTGKSESVRVAASNSLLDRHLGKPTQHIKTERVGDADLNSIPELRDKLETLRKEEEEIKKLGIGNSA